MNDRPYVSSSLMSVAMSRVLASAMSGKCKDRPELAQTPIPLTATIAAVPCRNDDAHALLTKLFEPLGYAVAIAGGENEAGAGRYWNVTLEATVTLANLLTHIYVLLPVADNRKHYWIGSAEVEKLTRRGKGWLESHPSRDLIVKRYLGYRKGLTTDATEQLLAEAETETDTAQEGASDGKTAAEKPEHESLHRQRLLWAASSLSEHGATRVVDLGCGEAKLIRMLADQPEFTELVGADASAWSLKIAARRLKNSRSGKADERIQLVQTALTFRDERLEGYDAATLIEVIEHIEPERLDSLERVIFGCMRPRIVLLTTPNREYNVLYKGMAPGELRHRDHRFEWTRDQFTAWAAATAERHGYTVTIGGVGETDEKLGQPTQTGVFKRCD